LADLGVDERIIAKQYAGIAWTGLIWLRKEKSGGEKIRLQCTYSGFLTFHSNHNSSDLTALLPHHF
jgi:hypothetical protein